MRGADFPQSRLMRDFPEGTFCAIFHNRCYATHNVAKHALKRIIERCGM